MRLTKYLSYSNNDDDINKFRSLRIGLTKSKNAECSSLLEHIYQKYNVEKIEPTIDNLNKELKKFYTGKYFYYLFLSEGEEKKINELTNTKKKVDPLILALFEANEKLSKMKTKVEEALKISLHSSPSDLK